MCLTSIKIKRLVIKCIPVPGDSGHFYHKKIRPLKKVSAGQGIY